MTALTRPRPAPWLRRLAGDRSEERVFRALAFSFLPAGVLFGLLAVPGAIEQAPHFPAWWTIAAFVAGTAPCLVLGALAFTVSLRSLRHVALVAVGAVILVQASVPLAVREWPGANGQVWFLQISGLGLIAAALAARPTRAALAQAVGATVIAATRSATDHADALTQGVQDGLYVLLFTLTFLALGAGALGAARITDREETDAAAAAASAAADTARERERARVNALVHDQVLATLLTAARPVPGSSELQRTDARRALAGLRALLVDGREQEDLGGEALIWQVQAVTTELAPEAVFGHELEDHPLVPGDVAEALLQAAEEALRNSLRHAGPANRTVHVRSGARGTCIDVLDDGVGFDRAQVPVERLGITDSIEGRMRALPGGEGDVISRPGVGTRVRLQWTDPEAP